MISIFLLIQKKRGVPIPEGSFIPSSISSELLGIFSKQGEFAKSASAFLKEAAVFLSKLNKWIGSDKIHDIRWVL